jgi:hypothetical protein
MMGDPLNSKPDDLRSAGDNPDRDSVKSTNSPWAAIFSLVAGIIAAFAAVFTLSGQSLGQFFTLLAIAAPLIIWGVYKLFLTDNAAPQRPYYSEPRHEAPVVPLSYPSAPENEPTPNLERRGHTISYHTREAIRAANQTLDPSRPHVVDVGLVVYRGTEKPAIYRVMDVPDDARAIQPFVQLHVPLPLLESGEGRVRFEILENSKDVVFGYEQIYTLKDGLNLLTPPARLPMKNRDKAYVWEMRVSLGNTLVAVHDFGWSDAKAQEDTMALGSDGEISEEMRKLLDEQDANQPLSLDDLLASNDEIRRQRG